MYHNFSGDMTCRGHSICCEVMHVIACALDCHDCPQSLCICEGFACPSPRLHNNAIARRASVPENRIVGPCVKFASPPLIAIWMSDVTNTDMNLVTMMGITPPV